MKFASALVFLNIIASVNCGGYKFLRIEKCIGSEEVNVTNCEITSSRFNATIDITRPLNKIFVRSVNGTQCLIFNAYTLQLLAKFFKIQKSEVRQVFKGPRIDWCNLMSGSKTTSGFAKGFINAVKDFCPVIFQQCPYQGHYDIANVAIGNRFLALLLTGTYRAEVYVTDDTGKMIATLSIVLEISN